MKQERGVGNEGKYRFVSANVQRAFESCASNLRARIF